MDDNPERRGWLDKLLTFMDERRTPIAACPTISKQPLDLYKLYLLVKERGGFVEVCKVSIVHCVDLCSWTAQNVTLNLSNLDITGDQK